jgi:DNA-binding transcriptional regulator YhcF (GntR family)
MEKEKQNEQYEPSNYSFTMVPDYFFRKLIKVMGAIPSMVYLSLLSYCHKKKYIAWPSLNTMSQETGLAKTTIIRNLNILIKQNFIKNIAKDNSFKNYCPHNVYQITPPEKIFLSHFPDAKNNAGGSVTLPSRFQNATDSGSGTLPQVVAERYPNNNNLNNNNITTTKREKDAVVAATDFKKLKEKGEEKMQVIRERMLELDFKEGFVEKILKEYSMKRIDEKLDLLMERRNIQRPAGWLSAALKNDYRGVEEERYDEEPVRQESQPLRIDSRFRGNDIKGSGNDHSETRFHGASIKGSSDSSEHGNLESTPEQVSRETALKAIKLIQDNLSACISPIPSGKRSRFRNNVGIRFIEPAKLRGG